MVAPPGGGAFRDLATGITMGAAPTKESSVKSLNGGRVAILKMHIPYAHFCMGIRTIAGVMLMRRRAGCDTMPLPRGGATSPSGASARPARGTPPIHP